MRLLMACVVFMVTASVRTETTAPVDLQFLRSMPEGAAEDNSETSRGISFILEKCAAAYADSDFYGKGTYIEGFKTPRVKEQVAQARFEVVHHHPEKLKVLFTGGDLAAGFIADGSKVLQVMPSTKQYLETPQPPSLEAYSESERAGELLDDESNAISRSLVGALVITRDPLAWIHANVVSYVYEGTEEVGGVQTWKIKFIQDSPQMVVMNWVETGTFLLRKVAIIQSLDSEGRYIQSYQDGIYAQMRLVIFDEMTTEARWETFEYPIPSDWEPYKPVLVRPREHSTETAWSRLLRAAASETGTTASVDLSVESGDGLLSGTRLFSFDRKITCIARSDSAGSASLYAMDAAGAVFQLSGPKWKRLFLSKMDNPHHLLSVTSGSRHLLITAKEYGHTVRALDLEGKEVWSFNRDSMIAEMAVSSETGRIYVAYVGGAGLYTLDLDGKVLFASRQMNKLVSVATGTSQQKGPMVLVANSENELGTYSSGGKHQKSLIMDDSIGILSWDSDPQRQTVLGISSMEDGDFALRSYQADGKVNWTAGLGRAPEDVEPISLRIVHRSGNQGTHYAVLMSNGQLHVVDNRGKPAWQGRLNLQGVATGSDRAATSMEVADIDADGDEEIYVAVDTFVTRIEFAEQSAAK